MRKYPITKIVIHHSTGGSWASIKSAHKAKGWGENSGYNWFVEKSGTIRTGVPEDEAGFSMHIDLWNPKTWWINEKSIAICVSGNFENEEPTQAQINTLKKMIAAKMKLYDITEVLGHRDINATACPGQKMYDLIHLLMPLPDWGNGEPQNTVNEMKKAGITTPPELGVGNIPLYQLLLLIKKYLKFLGVIK